MPSQPNILYVMFDQCRASTVWRNPLHRFPFMERMAASGITFTNAYATSPICTPSRTSVHTGVHPHVHQVFCYQNLAPYNLPQLAELLTAGGYETLVAGHYDPSQNLARGWRQEAWSGAAGGLGRSYRALAAFGRSDVGWSSGRRPGPPGDAHSVHLTRRMLDMIASTQADGAPFFAHLCYEDPHPPYSVPPPFDTLIDRRAVTLPDQGRSGRKPAWQRKFWEEAGTEKATEDDLRNMIAIYTGMVAQADAEMGRVFDYLESSGLLDNTWIIASSDHGDFLGEKGLFTKGELLYDCLLHVPLIIRPPGGLRAPRGTVVEGMVDLVDLFPTILGMAGAAVPPYAQGRDLLRWVQEGARPFRSELFSQVGEYHGALKNTFPGGIAESARRRGLMEGIRTADYSYIRDPDCGDEAYDLRRDPKELDNLLGGGPPPPAELDSLRRRLDGWRETCHRLRDELGIRPGPRGFNYE